MVSIGGEVAAGVCGRDAWSEGAEVMACSTRDCFFECTTNEDVFANDDVLWRELA